MENIDVVSDAVQTQRFGRAARRLAGHAGECLLDAYNSELHVEFKRPIGGRPANSNPVSSVDRRVESLVRAQLATEFPDHAVIGEEMESQAGRARFVWVIDPLDGTTNYINGLPLFAVSIGLLCEGWPLVGAIWCATTHEFHPGVYHAVAGGELQFDGTPLSPRAQRPWRGLAAEPGRAPAYGALWDTRVFGCATLEFAWVAAGLLRLAYIPRPALWDAVAGMVLLRAAGCEVRMKCDDGWRALRRLAGDLSGWSESVLIGRPADLDSAVRAA